MLLLKHNVVFLIKSKHSKNYNPFLYLIYIGIKFGIYFAHSFKIHKIGLIMSIEFVGMVFPNQWSETKGTRIGHKIDLEYLRYHARAHEYAGFDKVLIASGPTSPDNAQIAAYLAQHTERLGFMIAHRPALLTPNLAARSFATLDHTTGGGRTDYMQLRNYSGASRR